MSEGAQTSPNVTPRSTTPNDHHAFAGALIVGFAVITLALSIGLRPSAPLFGPTLEPRVISFLMVVLGILAMLGKVRVRNPQDFYGGIALVGLTVIALLATADLQGMRGFAFGPATAPRLFAGLLAALGALVTISGLTTQGDALEKYDVRAPALWSMAYFLFHYSVSWIWVGLSIVMALLGVFIAWRELSNPETRTRVRGPIFLVLSVLIFAEAIRPLGLVAAAFATICASALAAEDIKWRETLLWGIVLTAFCSLLFPYGLNLPFQLWPKFWY
jgi:hypothetical protein